MHITRDTTHNSTDYHVLVGFLKAEDPTEVYLVQNKLTGVIEFSHEVLPFVLEWLSHFQKRLDDVRSGKKGEDEVSDIVSRVN